MVARIDEHLGLASDSQYTQLVAFGQVDLDSHREALCLTQPIAAVLDLGQGAGLCLLSGIDPAADTEDVPLQYFARHQVEHDGGLVTRIDVAEVVIGHFGIDSEVVNGDQNHRRRAGLRKLPDIGVQVGHSAAGGSDDFGALHIQLSFLDRGAGTDQLRIFSPLSPGGSCARRKSASAAFS